MGSHGNDRNILSPCVGILHANCYVVKPVDFEKFVTVIKSINDFWLVNIPALALGLLLYGKL
jgi:hypothetical protein